MPPSLPPILGAATPHDRHSRVGGNPFGAQAPNPPLSRRGEDAANAAGEGTGVGGLPVGSRLRGNDEAPWGSMETGLRPVYGAIAPNGFLPTRE